MPETTAIPATREELEAIFAAGNPDAYTDPDAYPRALSRCRNLTEGAVYTGFGYAACLTWRWLSAAREQGRSEGLEKGLEIVSNSESVGGAFNRLRAAILSATSHTGEST